MGACNRAIGVLAFACIQVLRHRIVTCGHRYLQGDIRTGHPRLTEEVRRYAAVDVDRRIDSHRAFRICINLEDPREKLTKNGRAISC